MGLGHAMSVWACHLGSGYRSCHQGLGHIGFRSCHKGLGHRGLGMALYVYAVSYRIRHLDLGRFMFRHMGLDGAMTLGHRT